MIRALHAVAPGETVEFVGCDRKLEQRFRDQLLAYGLSPPQRLTVLQQAPMTIVLCEHVELALEPAIASAMRVRRSAS